MKLNAVGVTATDLRRSAEFYRLLGFEFEDFADDAMHVSTVETAGAARLMIDDVSIVREIIGEEPRPGNHSVAAIEFDAPAEVDAVAERVRESGFRVVKEPWDAFWGQRYAVVEDPAGYRVDLYAGVAE